MTSVEQLVLLSQKKLIRTCTERYSWLEWKGTYFLGDKNLTDLQILMQCSATLSSYKVLDESTIRKITDFYEMLLDSDRGN